MAVLGVTKGNRVRILFLLVIVHIASQHGFWASIVLLHLLVGLRGVNRDERVSNFK